METFVDACDFAEPFRRCWRTSSSHVVTAGADQEPSSTLWTKLREHGLAVDAPSGSGPFV
jgi:hypothetical protein